MSSLRNSLRHPLLAGAFVMMSLVTACADATGPSASKRSGYITTSSAITTTTKTDTTKTTSTTGTKAPAGTESASGYNVTAF